MKAGDGREHHIVGSRYFLESDIVCIDEAFPKDFSPRDIVEQAHAVFSVWVFIVEEIGDVSIQTSFGFPFLSLERIGIDAIHFGIKDIGIGITCQVINEIPKGRFEEIIRIGKEDPFALGESESDVSGMSSPFSDIILDVLHMFESGAYVLCAFPIWLCRVIVNDEHLDLLADGYGKEASFQQIRNIVVGYDD